MISWTVTVPVQVLIFPLASETVSATVLAPKSAQVKTVLLRVRVAIPQASVEELSILAAASIPVPDEFSCNV